ncbi:probable glycosyltransferase [Synechococcus sp. CC9902]|uniref:glycosyltransferase n=1 Tax=Synechococcus sp. (strain CC9902) TaxID=316279 RepID=UPI00005D3D06|nr:glycosyltransferase [Synechococcus sp. CC9902]ABB25084.1 probable glycosyltransferase [Synechococcus sp. CC9902]
MRILLIHQNFPGQFKHLVPYLSSFGHDIMCICSHDRPFAHWIQGWRYKPPEPPKEPMPLSQHLWFESLQRAASVADICHKLNTQGWVPDRILAHSGWGETLGIAETWPNIPQIVWPELWTLPQHGGYGFDPTLPEVSFSQTIEQLGRNLMTRLALNQAAAWVMPTHHQADSLPACFQDSRLNIIHEGINTSIASPNKNVSFYVRGRHVDASVPSITFVNRNLERLRGFDLFMQSLPELQRNWPDLCVFIVGDNGPGYGNGHPSGKTLREVMINELASELDFNRIFFLGRVPYNQLITLFQISWVHVYLSYPFVLSWSLLEAMSCGCSIVASEGMPVEEVITDNVNGLLTSMDNPKLLSARISQLLSDPESRTRLSKAARISALSYDTSITLPKLYKLIIDL